MRMVVDLPAPFGPRKPSTSPRRSSKLTPSTATTGPKPLGQALDDQKRIHRGCTPSAAPPRATGTGWRRSAADATQHLFMNARFVRAAVRQAAPRSKNVSEAGSTGRTRRILRQTDRPGLGGERDADCPPLPHSSPSRELPRLRPSDGRAHVVAPLEINRRPPCPAWSRGGGPVRRPSKEACLRSAQVAGWLSVHRIRTGDEVVRWISGTSFWAWERPPTMRRLPAGSFSAQGTSLHAMRRMHGPLGPLRHPEDDPRPKSQ